MTETRGTTRSPDGTPIAWFRSGTGPPMVLVHGATADHTAWRTVAPLLAPSHTLYAIDRRGRGASGDTPPYAIAREYEDVASVVDAVAAAEGRPVDVVGHSYGGRVSLGAALLSPNLRRLVVYEGAPAPDGRSFQGVGVMDRLEALAAADDREGLLSFFLASVVGMTRGRAGCVSPRPELAGPRRGRADGGAGDVGRGRPRTPDRSATRAIRIPVLQIIGGDSRAGLHATARGPSTAACPNGGRGDHPGREARRPPHAIPSASRPRSAPSRDVATIRPFGHD